MKKLGTLNSDISRILSYLRHTDTICIADCGLPCPDGVECIDLALKEGLPSFIEVLEEISKQMQIEKIYLADEIKIKNKVVYSKVGNILPKIETGFIAHDKLKLQSQKCKAIIRTGEMTPYANIILQSGCLF